MFNMDWTELLIIAVIAVLVVGPKELPGMLRTMGRYAGKMRKVAGEFRSQFDQAMKEAELDGVQQMVKDTKSAINQVNPVHELKKAVTQADTAVKDINKSVEAKPAASVNGAASNAAPAEAAVTTPASEPEKQSVAQRAAEAWKKAASDEGGA